MKKHPLLFLKTIKKERPYFMVVVEIYYIGLIAVLGVNCLDGKLAMPNLTMIIIGALIELGIRLFPFILSLPKYGKNLS